MCRADPVVAFAPWAVVFPRVRDGTQTDPAVAFAPAAAEEAVGGLAATPRKLGRESTLLWPDHRPQ